MAATTAASRLLNLRHPALHNVLRRHLILHPSAATTPTLRNFHALNLFHLENNSSIHSPYHSSSASNLSLRVSNFTLNPFGSPAMGIGAARTYARSAVPTDVDDNLVDEDGDFEDFDDKDEELMELSGSDFDDLDDDDEDTDEDKDSRPRRK